MKICFLANASSIHTKRWVEYFAKNGHDVHVISFEHPDIKLNGINIHIVKTNKRYLYASFPYKSLQFRRIINEIKPDIIHAHYITKYGIIGAFAGFHPFVISAWGSDILINARSWMQLPIKFVLKKADLIHCEGNNIRKALIGLGGESKKICRIYWGTDTHKFNPNKRSEKIRDELGIFDSPMIISSKNLEPLYDIDSLIRSIPAVIKKIPEAKFVIAGRGSQEGYLKQLVKSLDISDNVKFIGFVPIDDYPKYLASADIYVCTSLSDGGLAISTKEAMACGLPVIVTDFGDNGKWIENGNNGFVIPVKCPELLGDRIIYLIEHENVREKFAEICRKLVKDKFEFNDEMKKMELLYGELIRFN